MVWAGYCLGCSGDAGEEKRHPCAPVPLMGLHMAILGACRVTEQSQRGLHEWSCYLGLPLGPSCILTEVRCVSQDLSMLFVLMHRTKMSL